MATGLTLLPTVWTKVGDVMATVHPSCHLRVGSHLVPDRARVQAEVVVSRSPYVSVTYQPAT